MSRNRERRVRDVAYRGKVTFARGQRREPTHAEEALWHRLRNSALGARFRRQHPIGAYILDFYCAEACLAVEIDGAIHEQQEEYDACRDEWLASQGIAVMRIADGEVKRDLEGVLEQIRRTLR